MQRKEAEKLLAALIFDDLDEASKTELLNYLQTDNELRERLADMRMAAKVASDTVKHGPDPVLGKRRLKHLTKLARHGRTWKMFLTTPRLAAAAAIFIIGIVGLAMLQPALQKASERGIPYAALTTKIEADYGERGSTSTSARSQVPTGPSSKSRPTPETTSTRRQFAFHSAARRPEVVNRGYNYDPAVRGPAAVDMGAVTGLPETVTDLAFQDNRRNFTVDEFEAYNSAQTPYLNGYINHLSKPDSAEKWASGNSFESKPQSGVTVGGGDGSYDVDGYRGWWTREFGADYGGGHGVDQGGGIMGRQGGIGGSGGGGYGGGMGMMGGGMGMMGIYDYDREYRADNLIYLIEDTIEPDSWFDAGGEGSVTIYENKKLIILQTRDIHKEIETLLNEMRKSLGHQVAIETRFLVVTENFLEDIGLDVDFQWDLGGKWTPFTFEQSSLGAVIPEITKVPGSLAGIDTGLQIGGPGISGYAGYGNILDDLQVSFLVRATQAHTDATTLTAPKVTVLSGESATFQIQRDISYALPPTVLGSGGGAGVSPYGYGGGGYGYGSSSVIQNVQRIPAGTTLTITPTIDPEKKYVLLNIITYLQDLLRLKTHQVEAVIPGQAGTATTRETYTLQVPETESSSVQTRVSVPDGGTLLLGGQKISAEVEKEAGVPILSKLPILGRLFSNRTIVKDHKILLILVKPTIILQEEREKEAIAAMESKI